MTLLQNVADGVLTAGDAAVQLNQLPCVTGAASVEDTPKAQFPEVVWAEGKTAAQVATSLQRIAERQGIACATRVTEGMAAEVLAVLLGCEHNPVAHMLVYKTPGIRQRKLPGTVAIISAGTADTRVVEECRVMLQCMGCYCFKLPESGVMGMHR